MMQRKSNKIIKVSEYKETFRRKLDEIKLELTHHDKMKIAVELKLSLATVERYISGDADEIRRLEVAESILSTAKEVLREKSLASKTA